MYTVIRIIHISCDMFFNTNKFIHIHIHALNNNTRNFKSQLLRMGGVSAVDLVPSEQLTCIIHSKLKPLSVIFKDYELYLNDLDPNFYSIMLQRLPKLHKGGHTAVHLLITCLFFLSVVLCVCNWAVALGLLCF